MKNIMQLMQKAQSFQKDMEALQEGIKNTLFETTSGGGLVKLTMNGAYEIKSLDIDESIISKEDKVLMTDLVIAAYNDARRKVKDSTDDKMKELTSGLPIPPGLKLPGMF